MIDLDAIEADATYALNKASGPAREGRLAAIAAHNVPALIAELRVARESERYARERHVSARAELRAARAELEQATITLMQVKRVANELATAIDLERAHLVPLPYPEAGLTDESIQARNNLHGES